MLIKVTPFVKHLNRFISPAGRNVEILLLHITDLEEKNPINVPKCDVYQRFLPDKKIALLRGDRNFSQFFVVAKDKIQVVTRKLIQDDTYTKLIITKMNLLGENKNKTVTEITKFFSHHKD